MEMGIRGELVRRIWVFRSSDSSSYVWQGEILPIVDKTTGEWYFSFNPNIDFTLTGSEKGIGFAPQLKTFYTMWKKIGFGIEYYGNLGYLKNLLPVDMQEHLFGPMIYIFTLCGK